MNSLIGIVWALMGVAMIVFRKRYAHSMTDLTRQVSRKVILLDPRWFSYGMGVFGLICIILGTTMAVTNRE